jgi:regulator of protease activity HflC (stomatin/prohibitin superfamily)
MEGTARLIFGLVIGSVGGVLLGLLIYYLVRRRYITVSPSEYVIHTGRGGKVLHKGLGQSFFCGPFDSYMIFPSTIQRVQFEASQVTRENQGIQVQGFVVWKIADPELAYKSLDLSGTDLPLEVTNAHLKEIAESVVRHSIANMTVEETLRKRETMIGGLKEQLVEVVDGWGISVETIEIRDVRICSETLFENMQAPFRQQVRLDAETVTLETDEKIANEKLRSDEAIAKQRAETQTRSQIFESEKALEAQRQKIDHETTAHEAEQGARQRRMEKEHQVEIATLRSNLDVTREREQAAQEEERLTHERRQQAIDWEAAETKAKEEAERERVRIETATALEKQEAEHKLAQAMGLDKLALLEGEISAKSKVSDAALMEQLIEALPLIVSEMQPEHWTTISGDVPYGALEGVVARLLASAKALGIEMPRGQEAE